MVGEHVNTLGPGDSLHFNSGIQHRLSNIGETGCRADCGDLQPIEDCAMSHEEGYSS
jgi:uncharacterized cupin superfamily protein